MIKKVPAKHILSVKINSKREDMYMNATHFGLSHPIVIACSQELDALLNRYENIRSVQQARKVIS